MGKDQAHAARELGHGVSYRAYMAGVLFGCADCLFHTQVYALLGELFGNDQSADAFKIFQFFQNVGGAIGFVLPLAVGQDALAYANIAIAAVCTVAALTVPMRPHRSVAGNSKDQLDVVATP